MESSEYLVYLEIEIEFHDCKLKNQFVSETGQLEIPTKVFLSFYFFN